MLLFCGASQVSKPAHEYVCRFFMWMPMRDAICVSGFNMAVAEVGWRRSREVRLLHDVIAVRFLFSANTLKTHGDSVPAASSKVGEGSHAGCRAVFVAGAGCRTGDGVRLAIRRKRLAALRDACKPCDGGRIPLDGA